MKIIKVISFIIVVPLSSCKPTLPDLTKRDRIKLLKKYKTEAPRYIGEYVKEMKEAMN